MMGNQIECQRLQREKGERQREIRKRLTERSTMNNCLDGKKEKGWRVREERSDEKESRSEVPKITAEIEKVCSVCMCVHVCTVGVGLPITVTV